MGDYTAGDQEFEPKPKVSLAASYNINSKTSRSGGQLGSNLPNPVNMNTFIADMMLKYKGWGMMTEYYNRKIDGFTLNDNNFLTMMRIPRETGFNIQLSRMVAKQHELVIRYAGVIPESNVEDYQYKFTNKAIGYNYYLNKHRVKFQYYIALDDRQHPEVQPALLYPYKNRLNTMIQVELGI